MKKIGLIIFGLFLGAIALESGLRLAGFTYLFWRDYKDSRALRQADKGEYRILCLGESTTALGGQNAYPAQLERILNGMTSRPSRQVLVFNKGVPGIDTTGILSELKHNLNRYAPDMVIAMMGINDEPETAAPKGVVRRFKNFIKKQQSYKLARLLYARFHSREILIGMYIERGSAYLELHHYYEAEQMFNKVRELEPSGAMAYVWLGKCDINQNRFLQAQAMFDKAQALDPKDAYAYVDMGWGYYEMEKPEKAQAMFEKAIELGPRDYDLYVELAQFYHAIKDFVRAEEAFKRSISLMKIHDDNWPYSALGWHYLEREMYPEVEKAFRKALEIKPEDLSVYMDFGLLRQAEGKYAQAREYLVKAKSFLEESRQKTLRNYRALKDIVLNRGIKLICLQYPLRKLEDLRRMFGPGDDITFVDNEAIFREALKNGSFEDYFVDRFAGDFGHCSAKGNAILAENVARTILGHIDDK